MGNKQPRHEAAAAEAKFAKSAISAGEPLLGWPKPLAEATLYGLAGDIVATIEPHTEADPAALLSQLLLAFGNAVGRGPHFQIEADKHYTNVFVVLVGETSKARKGTSWGYIERLFKQVCVEWPRR